MEIAPALQQRASLGGTELAAGRQELVVRGHDAYQCERHHRPDKHSSNKPPKASAHKPRHDAAQKAQQRHRHLHPGSALVARCPLEDGHACLEPHARRMLGEIDIERSSGKERGTQRGDEFKRLKHRTRLPWGLDPMICPAYTPESLMIDATLAPKVEFTNSFGTSVCNANHLNA